MVNTLDSTSTRPYLIRALYEWCTDNGFTPYVAVSVDDSVVVPREYVRNGEIVLNVSFDATSALKLGNEAIEFKARFAGVAREIMVPIGRVMAVYARENGQGMAFPMVNTDAGPEGKLAKTDVKDTSKPPVLVRVPDASKATTEESNVVSLIIPVDGGADSSPDVDDQPPRPPTGGRPALKRIK